MINIKVSIPDSAPPIIRQTPNSSAKWGDCCFYINTDVAECDYWFVLDELNDTEKTICPSENLILITGEPPYVKLYPHKYVDQFFTCFDVSEEFVKEGKSMLFESCVTLDGGGEVKVFTCRMGYE